jgi:hypothetical protein
MEARMPVITKKHPKQTVQEAIREYNREFAREDNLMISLSEAKKLRLFKRQENEGLFNLYPPPNDASRYC